MNLNNKFISSSFESELNEKEEEKEKEVSEINEINKVSSFDSSSTELLIKIPSISKEEENLKILEIKKSIENFKKIENIQIESESELELELKSELESELELKSESKPKPKPYQLEKEEILQSQQPIIQKLKYKILKRTKEIKEQRKELPIIFLEREILELINNNEIIIICGETGSGKTTQLPQFLYEAGYTDYGKIGITEPRRVATVSMAKRVSIEMNFELGKEVGYQIRHERKLSEEEGLIKFMTDGILLKEIQKDILLKKYSIIIIDEAHERSLNTDVLIGILSRIIKLRRLNPLKLIIMSATLKITDFTLNKNLFLKKPPILEIKSRRFPVKIKFSKITKSNFIEEIVKKVKKIHQQTERGGKGNILIFLPGKSEIKKLLFLIKTENLFPKVKLLPLYSKLSTNKQLKVFKQYKNKRIIIASTNISETSLTIPGIKYVIDSGRQKIKVYNPITHLSKFEIKWTSKASAKQRTGRTGRQEPGICYRMYSSSIYENFFPEFNKPEILITPIDSIILNLKSMGITSIKKFPFPTPPKKSQIKNSLKLLKNLGALTPKLGSITPLGKSMSLIPLNPRFSKMILLSLNYKNLLSYVIDICSCLSIKELFISNKLLIDNDSDIISMLLAIGAWRHENCSINFAKKNDLRLKALIEINKLSNQIRKIFNCKLNNKPPSLLQKNFLLQIIFSGFIDNIAKKNPLKVNKYEILNSNSGKTDIIVKTFKNRVIDSNFIIFIEAINIKNKIFLRNLSKINSNWIPIIAKDLCKFGKEIKNSLIYDSQNDKVLSLVETKLGNWNLRPSFQISNSSLNFCKLLLKGKILKGFPKLLKNLSLLNNNEPIIKALNNISTLKELIIEINYNPRFLLNEFHRWFGVIKTEKIIYKKIWKNLIKIDI